MPRPHRPAGCRPECGFKNDRHCAVLNSTKPFKLDQRFPNCRTRTVREVFAGGTPNRFIFLSTLMNVKYKVISVKLFIKLKILRSNFNLLCLVQESNLRLNLTKIHNNTDELVAQKQAHPFIEYEMEMIV